jgi:FKBP-type peptidyl-prolyl cis-trans isomerase SlyD
MQNDRGETRSFFVSKIEADKLTVDGNHPFAGKTLTYAVTVADIRDASEEEKQKGISKPVMH